MKELPLPGELFKYFKVELDWLPSFLRGESLRFSSRTTFNDPFDSRPDYILERLTKPMRMALQQTLRESGKSAAWRMHAQRRIAAEAMQRRQALPTMAESLDAVGILCLTTKWDDILMWSHYGDHHKGICVGFRTDKDAFQLAHDVTYTADLPVIRRPSDDHDAVLRKAFLTKADCWRYENEWRILRPKQDLLEKVETGLYDKTLSPEQRSLIRLHDGAGIYPFDNVAITSITLGMRISNEDRALVSELARSFVPHASVYLAKEQEGRYKLTRASTEQ